MSVPLFLTPLLTFTSFQTLSNTKSPPTIHFSHPFLPNRPTPKAHTNTSAIPRNIRFASQQHHDALIRDCGIGFLAVFPFPSLYSGSLKWQQQQYQCEMVLNKLDQISTRGHISQFYRNHTKDSSLCGTWFRHWYQLTFLPNFISEINCLTTKCYITCFNFNPFFSWIL